jgi:hypothetical protein
LKQNVAKDRVRELMTEFARLTGLSEEQRPNRYLWTDAFAVCNFLELYRQTGTRVPPLSSRRLPFIRGDVVSLHLRP